MPNPPTKTGNLGNKKVGVNAEKAVNAIQPSSPAVIIPAKTAPLQATDKEEHINEGYLHSLIDQLHYLVKQLKTERAFLETTLQHMPCGVVIADAPSGRLRTANSRVDEFFREPFFPAKNIEEYRHWKGFHPDGRPYQPYEWPMARAIQHGEEIRGEEIRILRADGSVGYIEVNAAPLVDEKGKILAGIVSFNDVTDRKAARKGILENVQRLHLAQVAAGIGFWEHDIATAKVIWSDENFRLLGQDPKRFNPTVESFLGCVHPADRSRMKAHLQELFTLRKEARIEFRVIWPDGSLHWLEGRAQPFLFNGDPVRVFGVTFEITAQKILAENLESKAARQAVASSQPPSELRKSKTLRRKAKGAGSKA